MHHVLVTHSTPDRAEVLARLVLFLADVVDASPYAQVTSVGHAFAPALLPSLPAATSTQIISVLVINAESIFPDSIYPPDHPHRDAFDTLATRLTPRGRVTNSNSTRLSTSVLDVTSTDESSLGST